MKTVVILSTGDELIEGRIQDYNSYFICNKLFGLDFEVIYSKFIGDSRIRIKQSVEEAIGNADIVFITGGLGPTDDDLTLEVLSELFNLEAEIYKESYERMKKLFSTRKRKIYDSDLKMVSVPKGAHIFKNSVGLCSGYSISNNDRIVVAMPGVPREMSLMFVNEVLPYLYKKYNINKRESYSFKTVLLSESEVNDCINKMNIPLENYNCGITTTYGMNEITITQKLNKEFNKEIISNEVINIFGDKLLGYGSNNLEMDLLFLLEKYNKTISVAESCTGGIISKRLTDVPGSSKIYQGGVVTYSNDSKMNILGVSKSTLTKFGAVSEEVAKEMAGGVREKFNSNIGISTTGIAGPDGGTPEKPVGTVCFGFAVDNIIKSFTKQINIDRERVRFFSSQIILNEVRLFLKNL